MDASVAQPDQTMEILKIAAGGGAAIAVIAVVYKFLAFLEKERKARTEERAAERLDFKTTLDGVVKANNEALDRVVESNERSLRDLSVGLSEVRNHTVSVERKVDELAKDFRDQVREEARG